MSSKGSLIALGAGAYLAFAVTTLPAEAVYRWFAPAELRMADIGGTLWSGSAALGSLPGLPLSNIRWTVSPWPLLLGRASGRFEARLTDGFVRGQATATMSRIVLTDLQTSTRLETLAELLPLNDTIGLVSADLSRLELENGWPVRLAGSLRLGDLQVAPLMPTQTNELIPLGSYLIEFADTGGTGLAGRVTDTGGPLEVEGSLALDVDRNYILEGLVRARAEADSDLVRGLEIMTGEPDASGRRPFNLTGSL